MNDFISIRTSKKRLFWQFLFFFLFAFFGFDKEKLEETSRFQASVTDIPPKDHFITPNPLTLSWTNFTSTYDALNNRSKSFLIEHAFFQVHKYYFPSHMPHSILWYDFLFWNIFSCFRTSFPVLKHLFPFLDPLLDPKRKGMFQNRKGHSKTKGLKNLLNSCTIVYIIFMKHLYHDHGSSMRGFLVNQQLIQGQMADFPAFIALKPFDL